MSRRAKNPKVVAGVPFYNPDEQSARGRHVGTLLLIQGCVSLHPRPPAAMVSHCVDVIEIKTLSIYARWRRHEEDPRSAQGSASACISTMRQSSTDSEERVVGHVQLSGPRDAARLTGLLRRPKVRPCPTLRTGSASRSQAVSRTCRIASNRSRADLRSQAGVARSS